MKYLILISITLLLTSCYQKAGDLEMNPFDIESPEEWITMGEISIVPTSQNGIYKAEGLVTVREDFIPDDYPRNGLNVKLFFNNSNYGTIPLESFPLTVSETIYSGQTRCYTFQLEQETFVSKISNSYCATAP